ncbi:S1C family serine protease [Litoribrevibacter euphylliae]|uniref:S1C family serine protease n=1 Tax=Litoribrevibacter euphylliae TaxID=1834034 RepID=A0ABV7H931_9GAMM
MWIKHIRPWLMSTALFCGCLLSSPSWAVDVSNAYLKVMNSVVVLKTIVHEQQMSSQGITEKKSSELGSGVIIDPKGLVLTASHVVNLAESIEVTFKTGETTSAKVISSSYLADVALIQLDQMPDSVSISSLADSDQLKVGQEAFVIGAPYGLEHTLSVGNISGRRVYDDLISMEFLQTDAAINTGNSGGPMYNTDGELVGIVSHIRSSSGGNEGVGFVASINMIKDLLLNRPPSWIGADIIPIKGELARALNVPHSQGLLVQRVAKGSPAERLGLKPGILPVEIPGAADIMIGGDVIIQVGPHPIFVSKDGFLNVRDYLSKQDGPLQLTVWRGGEWVTLYGEN